MFALSQVNHMLLVVDEGVLPKGKAEKMVDGRHTEVIHLLDTTMSHACVFIYGRMGLMAGSFGHCTIVLKKAQSEQVFLDDNLSPRAES